MYYVILPSESVLDYLKDELIADYEMSVFITMDENKASKVLHTLNQLSLENATANSLVTSLLVGLKMVALAKKNEPAFQIKVISKDEKSNLIPYSLQPGVLGRFFENTEAYPYNYIFMEGIANAEPTIQEMKNYTDKYSGDKENIQKIRSTLGETYI